MRIELLTSAKEFLLRTQSLRAIDPFRTNILGSVATAVADGSLTYDAYFWWVLLDTMITEISKWPDRLVEKRRIWEDIKPVKYTLVHLGKSYNFGVWVAKNGDMLLPVVLEGHIKGGGEAGVMGVRLKRIKD